MTTIDEAFACFAAFWMASRAAEVGGDLDRFGEAADVSGVDRDRKRGCLRLDEQGGREPFVSQDRRVGAPCHVTEPGQRRVRIGA